MMMEEEEATNGEIQQPKQRTADISVSEDFTFSKFLLSDSLLKSLDTLHFVKPSPIQLKVVPLAKCGLDMIIQAKSGTGKTLAFAICLLESYDIRLKFPQALVVVPTREIAVQIVSVLNQLGKNMKNFKASEFIGGTDVTNDRMKIQSAKVIVGTPGRILHLITSGVFNISDLKALVLDEADKLFESGQMNQDVTAILASAKSKIQYIATTATVTDRLETIMKKVMKNPIGITPKNEIPVLLGIKQFVKSLPLEKDNIQLMNLKVDELHKILTRISFKQCLLFTNSQIKTESYCNYLNKRGWKSEIISGAQDQAQRLHVLKRLIKFKCRILITTDLMARGIDIENINLIINLDLPYDCCTYLHRIGRAGRFGTHGIAITLLNGDEELRKFQKMLGEIGGSKLKALQFPDESIQHDFWNFENKANEELTLGTISGTPGEADDDSDDDEVISKAQSQTVIENLALLQITQRMVDSNQNEKKVFSIDDIINDYEKNSEDREVPEEEEAKPAVAEPLNESIFLKAIEDLNLYQDVADDEDEDEDEEEENEEELPTEPASKKEPKQVIFTRTTFEDDEIEESESSMSLDESESESEEEEEEFEAEPEDQPQQPSAYEWYNQYAAQNYSTWQNIYFYQLANMQNYLNFSKK